MGQELMLNGLTGSLKLERAGGGTTARVVLPGNKISQPVEACKVPLNGGAPVAVSSEGRAEGVGRFEVTGGECPLRFDVLDGAVLVQSVSGPVCTFAAADCATTPTGLWGPAAATLISRASEFEAARGGADRAVRENYKLISQRLRGPELRPVVTEQAAFSSDREQMCRTYAREGRARILQPALSLKRRALALATRLGVNTNTAAPSASASSPRSRRKPPVEGMNPDTGGAPFSDQ